MIKVEIERVEGDYGFEARDANNHVVRIDTSLETTVNIIVRFICKCRTHFFRIVETKTAGKK